MDKHPEIGKLYKLTMLRNHEFLCWYKNDKGRWHTLGDNQNITIGDRKLLRVAASINPYFGRAVYMVLTGNGEAPKFVVLMQNWVNEI